jgi:PAS domain S-box-containing protein
LCCFCAISHSSGSQKNAPVVEKVRLKLKWRHQFQFADYYAAIEKGYYREAGLEVELIEARPDENPVNDVLSGNAEFGIAGPDLLLIRAQGHQVVALSAIFQHSPMVFITAARSGIENIHQLAGKKVMLESNAAELLAYLQAEGIKKETINLLPHSFGVAEMIEGKVDVISSYLTDEPFLLAKKGLEYRLFLPQSSGIDFYSDVLFTTEEQINNYPERVKAFVEASRRGWKYALNNIEEMVELILARYSQRHDRQHLLFEAEKSRPLIMPEVVEVGYMNSGRWRHIMSKYRDLGMLQEDIDLDRFIYNSDYRSESILKQAIQLGEIFFAILALGFIVRLIKSYVSLEELDRKNRRTNKKLVRSRQRYSMLLRNMPGMAYRCVLDSDWTILFSSRGTIELTGYEPETLKLNRRLSYASLIVPDDRQLVNDSIREAYRQKKPFKVTYRIRTASGEEKWVWEHGRFSGESYNGLPVIEGFITDINEEKKLESERQKLIEDLQNAFGEIRVLREILPICSSCRQIRDDNGAWNSMEEYIREHTNTQFSHGLCPDCAKKLFPEVYEKNNPATPEK